MHTHAGVKLRNPVTLTFNLLTSRSTDAQFLPWSTRVCVSSLVLLAVVVFLLERGHSQGQTDTQSHRCHWSPCSRIGYRQNTAHSISKFSHVAEKRRFIKREPAPDLDAEPATSNINNQLHIQTVTAADATVNVSNTSRPATSSLINGHSTVDCQPSEQSVLVTALT